MRDDAEKDPSPANPPYYGYTVPGEHDDEGELASVGALDAFKDPSSLPGFSGFDPVAVTPKVASRSEVEVVPPPCDDVSREAGAASPDASKEPDPPREADNPRAGEVVDANDWSALRVDSLKKPSEELAKAGPKEFQVCIKRGNAPLGLEAEVEHRTGSLLILEVKEGPVSEWNQAHPEAKVQPGDIIVDVNGVTGKATELVQVMKGVELLQMVIRRRENAE